LLTDAFSLLRRAYGAAKRERGSRLRTAASTASGGRSPLG